MVGKVRDPQVCLHVLTEWHCGRVYSDLLGLFGELGDDKPLRTAAEMLKCRRANAELARLVRDPKGWDIVRKFCLEAIERCRKMSGSSPLNSDRYFGKSSSELN